MAAAEGDTDTARRAWLDAGLPETGSVTVRQLAAALAVIGLTEIRTEPPSSVGETIRRSRPTVRRWDRPVVLTTSTAR